MKRQDFYYDLPQELIAQYPVEPRDQSRLLVLDRATGKRKNQKFFESRNISTIKISIAFGALYSFKY